MKLSIGEIVHMWNRPQVELSIGGIFRVELLIGGIFHMWNCPQVQLSISGIFPVELSKVEKYRSRSYQRDNIPFDLERNGNHFFTVHVDTKYLMICVSQYSPRTTKFP